jgi:hypothetical protein
MRPLGGLSRLRDAPYTRLVRQLEVVNSHMLWLRKAGNKGALLRLDGWCGYRTDVVDSSTLPCTVTGVG